MNNTNYAFFEEYKRLDKLCCDMYQCSNGVTQYIEDMNTTPFCTVSNWRDDLEQLKRLRHIRNDLAHTQGAFSENLCSQQDIDWIHDFYNRILQQTDPLAMRHRLSSPRKPASAKSKPGAPVSPTLKPPTFSSQAHTYPSPAPSSTPPSEKDRDGSVFAVIITLLIILILIFLVILGGVFYFS